MQDHPKHAAHRAQLQSKRDNEAYLPTPHGRALAPWREWDPNQPEQEGTLPAKDRFAYRT